ncbi:MAG: archaeosine biosynthesis radical SAM protein RaSEA [Euryarchaeota archaeon]|nr:archaeosine biosynthesis radical SAM protein RaSEA [Euryarchaeota archaeon]
MRRFWKETDYLDGEVSAGAVVLPAGECAWAARAGCHMCGYSEMERRSSPSSIIKTLSRALEELSEVEYLKIFNSGSFFDERQIPAGTRAEIYRMLRSRSFRRVQVESRPEFLTEEVLEEAVAEIDAELEVGIGLESASDYVREVFVNKGFSLSEFEDAVRRCREAGVRVKAYLLVKPPFMSEAEAVEDAVESGVTAARLGAERLSYNPVCIHRGTLVERLFLRGEYSPPWLWSVVEVLRRVKGRVRIPVVCHPSGAGTRRGASNCRRCSARVAQAIRRFSATQEMSWIEGLECSCRERWRLELRSEVLAR